MTTRTGWASCAAAGLAALGAAGGQAPPGAGADFGRLGPRPGPVDPAGYALVRHVAPSGSDAAGDGSPAKPWATLRHGLARSGAAGEGRRIALLAAGGVYRERALRLRPHVDLYGGFQPGSWRRDPERFPSVVDAEGRDRLLVAAEHCRVDGFTLRGGRTAGHGGAVLCDGVSPVLVHNTFVENGTRVPSGFLRGMLHQVGGEGAAIACLNYARPRIEHNLFLDNTTEIGGGTIALRSQSARPAEEVPGPVIRHNLFVGNHTGVADTDPDRKKRHRASNGAAIALSNYQAVIEHNLFLRNRAGGNSDGGGIYCEYDSSPRIARNHFVGNSAEDDGGAIYVMKLSEPQIEENLVAGSAGGGAIRLSKHGRARILRNRVVANPGGGVNCGESWMLLEGNWILDNGGSGVMHQNRASEHLKAPVLTGNLIRGNAGAQVTTEPADPVTARGNNVQGGFPGAGNHDREPGVDRAEVPLLGIEPLSPRTGRVRELRLLPASPLPGGGLGRVVRLGDSYSVIHRAEGAAAYAWWDGPVPAAGAVLGSFLPGSAAGP